MQRDRAIELLRSEAAALRSQGATALYLFGSTARDAASPASDLDIFLDIDPTIPFSLFDLVGLQRRLTERMGVAVDLTTRDALHPLLRDGIEASAIRVF